jgi:hypothetical protein
MTNGGNKTGQVVKKYFSFYSLQQNCMSVARPFICQAITN